MSRKRYINDVEIQVIDGCCTFYDNSGFAVGGTFYNQLRFNDGTKLSGLLADGYLASFVEGDGKTFYVANSVLVGQSMLLGVVDQQNVFHEMDDAFLSKKANGFIKIGLIALAVGIPLSAIAVGIAPALIGAFMIYRGKKMQKIFKAACIIRDEHTGLSSAASSAISQEAPMAQSTWWAEKLKIPNLVPSSPNSIFAQLRRL